MFVAPVLESVKVGTLGAVAATRELLGEDGEEPPCALFAISITV
jgi:hypothetical protein